MKKITIMFMILIFSVCFISCGETESGNATFGSEALYTNEYMDDEKYIFEEATNIVKGKLVSIDDFEHLKVYEFSVVQDYLENVSDNIIHVYDQYDERFKIGNEYNLFLLKKELVLYPHTVYTSVVKNTVFDAYKTKIEYGYDNRKYILDSETIPDVVAKLKLNSKTDTNVQTSGFIKRNNSFTEAIETADIVAEVKLLSEYQENPYVSMYEIEVLDVLQGSNTTIATKQLLQPNLALNEKYYLLLRQTEDGRSYSIFDPTFSVTRLTGATASEAKLATECK